MIYSVTALQNIIIENIMNKRVVYIASELYYKNNVLFDEKVEEFEQELTQRLLNKEYERPRPEKPVMNEVNLD